MSRAFYDEFDTPLGRAVVVCNEVGHLRSLYFVDGADRLAPPLPDARHAAPEPILRAFDAYFASDVSALAAIACDVDGTDFQQKVWRELRRISAGSTASYTELAQRLGDVNLARAVGAAAAANPALIVCPCHRLIGARGELTGYAGGLWRKQWLLHHEGSLPPTTANLFGDALS